MVFEFMAKADRKREILEAIDKSLQKTHHSKLEAFNRSRIYMGNFIEKYIETANVDFQNKINRKILDFSFENNQSYAAIIKTYSKLQEKFLDDRFTPCNRSIGKGLIKRLGKNKNE